MISLLELMRRLDMCMEVENKLYVATNCSFLYHHRVILPTIIKKFSTSPAILDKADQLLDAIMDCSSPLKSAKHLSGDETLVDGLQEEIQEHLKDHVLEKLCKEVETELRLSTHSHLKLDDRNPYR